MQPDFLRFRAPLETTLPHLDELLRRAWPEGTDGQRKDLFERGGVEVDGRTVRDGKRSLGEGALVTTRIGTGQEAYGIPEANELTRGPNWILVEKPTGMPGTLDRDDPMNPILFLADMLGLDRDTFTPVWEMPTRCGGPWLFGFTPEDAAALSNAWRSGQMMLTFTALTRRLELPRGQLLGPGNVPVSFAVTRYVDGLCEVQLIPEYGRKAQQEDAPDPIALILEAMATANAPLLGDREREGFMVDGGLRLRLAAILHDPAELGHSYPTPSDWWPQEPVIHWVKPGSEDDPEEDDFDDFEDEDDEATYQPRQDQHAPNARDQAKDAATYLGGDTPTLRVSDKTIEVMEEQGHPWVLEDSQTAGRDHLKPGTLVRLMSRKGKPGPWALTEGPGELAARKWADSADLDSVLDIHEETRIRVDEAIVKRAELYRDMADTDLFRIIHGEADGLPGIFVDRIGPLWRSTVFGKACRRIKRTIYESILENDPRATLIEIRHTEDIRTQDQLPVAKLVHEGGFTGMAQRVVGLEDGLRYWCEPWEGIDVGFFSDQRENRRKLKTFAAPGQRWLNLFGHTGAFSVALASKGAAVLNVDVSRRYLDWTRENFELNHLDPALDIPVCEDARAFLKGSDEKFDGIIVDPPTASQGKGKEGFWSVRKGYEELLVTCFEHLAPGGVMLVCRNDRKGRGGLDQVIERAAKRAGHPIKKLEPAPPSLDYPTLEGFPEGDTFEGWLVR
jgi:23S rRNA (cytosine1962-C5)-methyltransferase